MPVAAPAPLLIALALAIVRSKSPGHTVRDYVTILRNTVKCASSDCHRCRDVDPGNYWRKECLRLQDELDMSATACAVLQAECRYLLGTDVLDVDTHSQKRKADSTSMARGGKRRKTFREPASDEAPLPDNVDHDENVLQLMGLVYDLQQLQNSPETQLPKLSSLLCHTTSTLSTILKGIVKAAFPDDNLRPEQSEARATSLAVGLRVGSRVVAALIQGYDVLDLHGAPRQQTGSVAYHMVHLFSSTLSLFIESCEPQRAQTTTATSASTTRKSTSSARRKPSDLESPATAIAQYLSNMIHCLDTNKQHHADLFEGFMHHLLQPIGQILSIYTPDPVPASSPTQPHITPSAAPIAAPHLLHLLRQALSLAPRFFRLPARPSQSHPGPTLIARSGLTTQSLAKLQRTLIHAALGEDLNPLDAAAARLRVPDAYPEAQQDAKKRARRKEMTPAAFKNELWSVLGWEILAYEGDLADFIAEERGH